MIIISWILFVIGLMQLVGVALGVLGHMLKSPLGRALEPISWPKVWLLVILGCVLVTGSKIIDKFLV